MPGPTQPWDQSEDPRESTVDLPRLAPQSASPHPAVVAQPATASSAPPAATQASAPAESTGFARAGRSPKGSLAELRSRLARLPAGHPSSPYDDAGQVRPMPTGLKQLELGLPAPEREPASSVLPDTRNGSAEPAIRGLPEPEPVGLDVSRPQLPEPAEPVSAKADSAEPELAEPELAEPELAEPELAEPELAEPELAKLDVAELEVAELDVAQPDLGELISAEPEGAEPEGAEPDGEAVDDAAPGFSSDGAADDGPTPFPVFSGDGHRPARPEWGNPYASYGNGNGHAPSDSSADINLGPWQPGPPRRVSGLEGLSSAGGNGHGPANGHVSGPQRASQPRPDRLDAGQRDAARQDTLQHRTIQPGARRPDSGSRQDGGPRHEPDSGRRYDSGPSSDSQARRDSRPDRDGQPRRGSQPGYESTSSYERGPSYDSRPRHGNGPRSEPDSARSRGEQAQAQTSRPNAVGHAAADLRALVERTLASCRTAEGRTALGSYGSSGLTPAIRRVSANLPFGGLAPGSEADSLKSPDRLAAKFARLIARNPGRTAAELAAAISDVVRYAFAFEADDYVEGTWLVHRRLKSQGFDLEIRRNRWDSPEYKGIFTQWRDPAHQLAFEVQFHTPASWGVVRRTHDAYVQITDPATTPAERARLRARQVAAAAAAKAPPNWTEITDFRLEPR
jgi:hypothetical protein